MRLQARVREAEMLKLHREGEVNHSSGILIKIGLTPLFKCCNAGMTGGAMSLEGGVLLNCSDDDGDRLSDGVKDRHVAAFPHHPEEEEEEGYSVP
jgi:hypothetical protein